jgi:hypothetical protein
MKGVSVLRSIRPCVFFSAVTLLVAACGGDNKSDAESSGEAQAACTRPALTDSPDLPKGWPDISEVTYTLQAEQGPTTVVEGYFEGTLETAHDDFKRELEAAGFTVLFDEIEEDDSEVSWKGEGRSGQVGLRKECASDDKIFVHVTNRPA